MTYPSPLRYPGSKKKLIGFIQDVIKANDLLGGTYVEPFAGGASVALYLLYSEYVNTVIINDIDRSIYAFWFSVLNDTENLCRLIKDTAVSVEEWDKQRKIQDQKEESNYLELGFSTFYLNRTNRSGIIKGGIIGGRGQTGKWKIDCRYNKDDLIKRIEKVALYANRIELHNQDAIEFVTSITPAFNQNTFIYFDPPYYNQGAALYANFYTHESHKQLSEFIYGLNCKWMLTYDYTPDIVALYSKVEKRLLTLSYTAAQKVKGCEMIAFCDGLRIPEGRYSAVTIE
ncbi:DNA adenine methylase [Candidatus Avoscillospira sp. LCP25S3_F1]|uniref:DNA adenine methylase n=1 Tax=Candidatus Avoscillospira sp. LCP25S3_F1 TaxID=3438825 RepID=UPI003F92267F